MIKNLIIVFFILISTTGNGQMYSKSDLSIGDKYSFNSQNLGASINLFIGLPKNYYESSGKYPVHYVLDGQIIFSYYYGVTDMLTKGEIPESIVVGIQSVKRDYYFKPGDGSNQFTNFLLQELIPFIDDNYRTNKFRLIVGHSTTGAFIVNTFINSPGAFDVFIAGAPYHSDLFLQQDISSKLMSFDSKKYFYSFYGLQDNQNEKSNWDTLAGIISQKQQDNFELIKKEYEDEGHFSILFRYIPDGLITVFKDWGYAPKEGKKFSYVDFIKYSDIQQKKYNVAFNYSESYFISNAMQLIQQGESKTAIELLEYGLNQYPNSFVLHNIIAVEYEKNGQKDLAVKHYKVLLEENPNLDFVKNKLKELE